ncbi:MAG: hypothetical protein RIR26_1398 [Pseudomonadota bacterium]|jgi:hypothetical protein
MANLHPNARPEFAEPLMITSRCSAGCSGCPFGSQEMPQRWMPVGSILERMRNSRAALVVVTGGEPLEHPEFDQLTEELLRTDEGLTTPFRLATGGHVPLAGRVEGWTHLRAFEGISLGTDVLNQGSHKKDFPFSENHPAREKISIWKENVRWLNEENIPYSLTLTLFPNHDETVVSTLLGQVASCGAHPQFIYVRLPDEKNDSARTLETINQFYPHVTVVFDAISF